jgi:hypothetical protein
MDISSGITERKLSDHEARVTSYFGGTRKTMSKSVGFSSKNKDPVNGYNRLPSEHENFAYQITH